MIQTAIITAPRPSETLTASLASYRAAGFAEDMVTVFADGDVSPVVSNRHRVIRNPTRLGNLRNWAAALSYIFTRTDAPYLMVCEDDITWAEHAYSALMMDLQAYAQSQSIKRTGAISLYCPIRMSNDIEAMNGPLKRGWYHSPRRGMKTWGAQCLLFTRRHAHDLLSDPRFNEYLKTPKWTKNVDGIVAQCINERDLFIAYRIPCLVDHDLGDGNSSLGYANDRPNLKTKYFTGQP
jgi:GR25 family glycosyltransferase involved in LPS biosynthesis